MKHPLSLDDLAGALTKAPEISEFHINERNLSWAERRISGATKSNDRGHGSTVGATVYVDRKLGRGHSEWSPIRGSSLSSQIREASKRALGALGPSWRLSPPAAPARVTVHDANWLGPSNEILDSIVEDFQRQLPASLLLRDLHLGLRAGSTRSILSSGFDNEYQDTLLDIAAVFESPAGRPISIKLRARRATDLRLPQLLEEANLRIGSADSGETSPPGDYDLVILPSSYLPTQADDFGLWTPLAQQCNAGLVSAGLARYRSGQRIVSEPPRGDLLTLRSDGAREYGLRSAPFSIHGEPVRRFFLVREGVAAGLALDHRAAGLASTTANGGVRNLAIHPGSMSFEEITTPGQRDLLVVGSLSEVHSEARGELCLQIEDAQLHPADGSEPRPVRGGVALGDIYQWLLDARFCSEMGEYGWYQGPIAWRFNQVRVR